MADDKFEGEIRIDAGDAIREVKRLTKAVESLETETKEAKKSGESWQTSWNQGLQLFDNVTSKATAAYNALRDLGLEQDRQIGVIRAYGLSIDGAADRINGLISDIDLLTARNQLAQAGIFITDEAFGDLAVTAANAAGALGTDAVGALDSLTQGFITGGEELMRFGINVSDATELTDKHSLALDQLAGLSGDAEAEVASLGGAFAVFETRLSNMQTDLFETVDKFDRMSNTSKELSDNWDKLQRSMQNTLGFDVMETAALGIIGALGGVSNMFLQLSRGIDLWEAGNYAEAITAFGSVSTGYAALLGGAQAVSESVQGGRNDGWQDFEEVVTELPVTNIRGNIRPSGRGSRTQREELASLSGLGGDILGGIGGGLGGSLLDATATAGAPDKDQLAELALAQQEAMIEAKMREIEATDKLMEAEQARFEALQAQTDQVSSLIGSAVFAAIEAEETFGKALQGIVVNELKGLARTEAVKSIAAFAAAATRGAFGDAVGAKLLAKAGGLHAAAAAAAGAGAAAVGAAGGGGGSGGGGGRSAADGLGGGRDRDEGGSRNVTVIFNNPVPLHEVGRMQNRALRAAERRYGDRA